MGRAGTSRRLGREEVVSAAGAGSPALGTAALDVAAMNLTTSYAMVAGLMASDAAISGARP